jgi:hypothetical protein
VRFQNEITNQQEHHMFRKYAPYALALLAVTAASSAAQAQLALANDVSATFSDTMSYNTGSNAIDLGATANPTSTTLNKMPMSLNYGSVDVGISFSADAGVLQATQNNILLTRLNSTSTFTFSADQKYFAMRWGSLDAGNTINFYNDNQLVSSVTGATVVANVPGITPVSSNYGSHYAEFAFNGGAFDKIVMSTTQGGFDVTQLAFASEAVDVAPIPLNAASLGGLLSFIMMLGMRGKGGTQVMVRMAFASLLPRRRELA